MKRNLLLVLFALIVFLLASYALPGKIGGVKPTPTVRRVMEASDPSTFVWAAGYPQFVEFFAFW